MDNFNSTGDALEIPGDAGRRLAQQLPELKKSSPELILSPMLCEVCGAERPDCCGMCRNCGNYICAEG